MNSTVKGIRDTMLARGFEVLQRAFELNIVGLRGPSTRANSFDDTMNVIYRDDSGTWRHKSWPCTTDPGTYWLRNPMNPQGTAILKGNMQYRGVYAIGLHKGQYEALVQRLGPVTVIRDYDRDADLDFLNGSEATGSFGINIHRASRNGTTVEVDRYSAGCQVFADAGDFAEFMEMCRRHSGQYGNRFNNTLFDLRSLQRTRKRTAVMAIGSVSALAMLLAIWRLVGEGE